MSEFNSTEKSRLPRVLLAVPLGLLVIGTVAWFVLQWAMRGPFLGETHHDFGIVAMPETGPTVLMHDFLLTNRSGRPITITTARPDCACVDVTKRWPATVAPGDSITVPITMTYNGSDARGKTVHIHLDLGEAGSQSLWVHAKPQRH